ncbi:MAG TPA: DUF1858 domain-containing protein [Bacillota bacterium]|nr:DUF1858 domain-containing protein [Bacillota bacterium]
MVVTKDTILADILNADQECAPIFFANGLHCLGCAMASGETIAEACMVHNLEADSLIQQLNDYFAKKG